ncbi:ATP-binding cassette domain-containing protein [Streptomyces sp. NPDC056373]|uniref:ATP-binding cassette domain-containing protein n=1 Tax=Streptomyces sp. NPDC056373 TaxID=3345798 RepID=UPI0035D61D88
MTGHQAVPGPSGTDTPAVLARGLRKAYGRRTALDGLHLTVPHGTAFALLGTGSSGKTTALRVLAAHTPADGGRIRVAGYDPASDPRSLRAAAGLLSRAPAVDGRLTAEENLLLTPRLRRLPAPNARARAAGLIEQLGLTSAAAAPAATLPGDLRRRLALALLLAGEPEVALLDEPAEGLDAVGRRLVRGVVRDLAADGAAVVFTTCSPHEAVRLADRIGVLHRGRIVAEGTREELLRLVPGGHIRLHFATAADLATAAGLFRLHTAELDPTALSLQIPGDGSAGLVRAVLDVLDEARLVPRRLSVHSPGIEDVFTALTGGGPRPAPPAGRAVPGGRAAAGGEPRGGRWWRHSALPVMAAALLLLALFAQAGRRVLLGALPVIVLCAVPLLATQARAGPRHHRAAPSPGRTGPP